MRLISFLSLIILATGCKKEDPNNPGSVDAFGDGLLVLNEGLFQQNNSSLSWINLSSDEVNTTIFEQKTNRQLGDTGNDIQRYGNKIYIVVSLSSTVEVLDNKTGGAIAQLAMTNNGTPKQPRSIAFAHGKAFISCFDGFVDVLDTTSLSIVQRIPVGLNPDHIHNANGKIYVSNSGGLASPAMDSTVSVIDPLSNTELEKIIVGKNPGAISSDQNGHVFVVARGNYGSIPSRLVRIENGTNQTSTYSFNASSVTKMNTKFLIHSQNGTVSSVKLFNPQTQTIENENYVDLTQLTTLYNLQFDPSRNRIYCFDAMNYTNTGYVRVYTSTGSFLKSYHVGLNPSKALIYD